MASDHPGARRDGLRPEAEPILVVDAGVSDPDAAYRREAFREPRPPDAFSCSGPVSVGVGFGFGYFSDMFQTETPGVVRAVSDEALVIEAEGGPFRFRWHGPGLAAAFIVDEPVRLQYQRQWSIVLGVRSRAAALRVGGAFSLEPQQQVPGGPSLDYSRTCHPFYSVTARLAGATTAVIPPGETGAVGPWQITNVHAWHPQPGPSEDPGWLLEVTALRTEE